MTARATAPALALSGVRRSFGDVAAVAGVDLEVAPGELLGLLGPSGCGKTTTLRLIAGLERPDAGRIHIAGVDVTHVAPERRAVGMVFQDYALFPHLTVAQNTGFGLGRRVKDRRDRIGEALELVGLSDLGRRRPHELSGGQQQRVALARALALRPALVLLDEPFSNLDAALRVSVREDIRRILRDAGATTVFVTHDQEEALSLADRVAVMNDGVVEQVGTPTDLYDFPRTRFVADFVGDAQVFSASDDDGTSVTTSIGRLPVFRGEDRSPVRHVVVRPERIVFEPDHQGIATIVDATFFGHDQLVRAQLADGSIVSARQCPPRPVEVGARINPRVDGAVPSLTAA